MPTCGCPYVVLALRPAPPHDSRLADSAIISTEMVRCFGACHLYTSPSPRDGHQSRMPSSAKKKKKQFFFFFCFFFSVFVFFIFLSPCASARLESSGNSQKQHQKRALLWR